MIDAELTAIADLWADRSRRDEARAAARALVDARHDLFLDLTSLSLEDLVKRIDAARLLGQLGEVRRVDAFLLARHEPQTITGSIQYGA